MIDQKIEKRPRTTEAEGRQKNHDRQGSRSDESSQFSAFSISLPTGGGAIRGFGEKFAANPVTGTGSIAYFHDAHRNMTETPRLPLTRSNFNDQLIATSKQVVSNSALETTYPRVTQISVAKRSLRVVLIRPSLAPCEVVLKAVSRKAAYPAQKTRQYPHSQ